MFSSVCFLVTLFTAVTFAQECIELRNIDFDEGTYRILEANTCYIVMEDLVFDPNPGIANEDGAWTPDYTFNNGFYDTSAFSMGFFAGITVEADNIDIDLNGFEMSTSFEFYIQQRFYAHIEIASQPFENNQGPGVFSDISYANNVYIHNGRMGLSPHHGIHSNGASNVTIEGLDIYDFEVAAIQFNGFTHVTLNNLDIGPSKTEVPTNRHYSNGRFLLPKLRALLDENEDATMQFSGRNEEVSLSDIEDALTQAMDAFFLNIVNPDLLTDEDDEWLEMGNALFLNNDSPFPRPRRGGTRWGLPDGASLYGIVLNSFGAAINGFGTSPDNPSKDDDVTITNVRIRDLQLATKEIPGYFTEISENEFVGPMRGPHEDVYHLIGISDFDNDNDESEEEEV
jgi:hypothetical protein